jgi:hypothetical protein
MSMTKKAKDTPARCRVMLLLSRLLGFASYSHFDEAETGPGRRLLVGRLATQPAGLRVTVSGGCGS